MMRRRLVSVVLAVSLLVASYGPLRPASRVAAVGPVAAALAALGCATPATAPVCAAAAAAMAYWIVSAGPSTAEALIAVGESVVDAWADGTSAWAQLWASRWSDMTATVSLEAGDATWFQDAVAEWNGYGWQTVIVGGSEQAIYKEHGVPLASGETYSVRYEGLTFTGGTTGTCTNTHFGLRSLLFPSAMGRAAWTIKAYDAADDALLLNKAYNPSAASGSSIVADDVTVCPSDFGLTAADLVTRTLDIELVWAVTGTQNTTYGFVNVWTRNGATSTKVYAHWSDFDIVVADVSYPDPAALGGVQMALPASWDTLEGWDGVTAMPLQSGATARPLTTGSSTTGDLENPAWWEGLFGGITTKLAQVLSAVQALGSSLADVITAVTAIPTTLAEFMNPSVGWTDFYTNTFPGLQTTAAGVVPGCWVADLSGDLFSSSGAAAPTVTIMGQSVAVPVLTEVSDLTVPASRIAIALLGALYAVARLRKFLGEA